MKDFEKQMAVLADAYTLVYSFTPGSIHIN